MSRKAKQQRGPTKQEQLHTAYERLARLRQIDRKTIAECAVAMQVSPRTIDNYLACQDYRDTVDRLRLDWVESARTTIMSLSHQAIQTLVALLDDPRSGHVRFEAAKELLEIAGVKAEAEKLLQQDDSIELERLTKILASRPHTTINVFNQPLEEGGFLPRALRSAETPDSDYMTAAQRLRALTAPPPDRVADAVKSDLDDVDRSWGQY